MYRRIWWERTQSVCAAHLGYKSRATGKLPSFIVNRCKTLGRSLLPVSYYYDAAAATKAYQGLIDPSTKSYSSAASSLWASLLLCAEREWAIKLYTDLSLSFLRVCYTYRSTGSSDTTTTLHIYKHTVEYRSDGCVLLWKAIYRDCATKQEGCSPFFFLSCLATTISMRIYCHRRAQEDRSDYIGGVGREGQCLIRDLVETEKENEADHVSPAAKRRVGRRWIAHDAEVSTNTSRLEERRQSWRNDPTSRAVVPKRNEEALRRTTRKQLSGCYHSFRRPWRPSGRGNAECSTWSSSQ